MTWEMAVADMAGTMLKKYRLPEIKFRKAAGRR